MEIEYDGYKIVGNPAEVKEFLGFLGKKGKAVESVPAVRKGNYEKSKANTNWRPILGMELIEFIKFKFQEAEWISAREIFNAGLERARHNGYQLSPALRKRMISTIWNGLAKLRTAKKAFDAEKGGQAVEVPSEPSSSIEDIVRKEE